MNWEEDINTDTRIMACKVDRTSWRLYTKIIHVISGSKHLHSTNTVLVEHDESSILHNARSRKGT
jgi:hypothetical protein